MPLSYAQKLSMYKERYADLYDYFIQRIKYVPFIDLDNINDFDFLLSEIEKNFYTYKNENKIREKRLYILFANQLKVEDHFMSVFSKNNLKYMEIPIDELYGRTEFQDILTDSDNYTHGVVPSMPLHKVTKTDSMYSKNGEYSIVYFESEDVELIENIKNIHPYYAAHTMHELFRLLLEWQWAYKYTNNTEPMAVLSNTVLTDMGISIEKTDVEPTDFLSSMPDMYISQFIKGITLSSQDIDPSQSVGFKLWSVNNGPFSFENREYAALYENILFLKKTKQKIDELENNL
jgi:hypothetical protein